jgi:hypothetical protein
MFYRCYKVNFCGNFYCYPNCLVAFLGSPTMHCVSGVGNAMFIDVFGCIKVITSSIL